MGRNPKNRREWFIGTAALAAAGCAVTRAGADDTTDAAVLLVPDPSRTLFRVRMEMDVEGNVNIPANALVSKEKSIQTPLKASSVLDWEERVLGYADDRTVEAAERFYFEGSSVTSAGKSKQSTALGKDSRHVFVRRNDSRWVLYSPETYLSGKELELLDVPASSLAIDALLPLMAVRQGDKYSPDKSVLAKLLALASVDDSDVTGEIHELTDERAKIHFKGKIQGSALGVPTVIDVVGKMVFDRGSMACEWLALAIREQREIGKSEPGFDVAATIKMIRKPVDSPIRLSSIPVGAPAGPIPADRLYCELQSTPVGFATLMDRRWKIMADAPGATMLRMIENDRGIAQCDVRRAGKLPAGKQLSMTAFVADVRQSLGKQFGRMLESREDVNDAGLRMIRATAQGAVEGVPVQWVFFHFTDESGRRLFATMIVAGADLDTFAGSEIQFASSMRFVKSDDERMTEVASLPKKASK